MIDLAKIRREDIRWHLLQAVNLSRPVGIYTEPLLVIVLVYPDATHHEVRLALDYLEERELVAGAARPDGRWMVELHPHGHSISSSTTSTPSPRGPAQDYAGVAMPRRSSVHALPPELKEWLDAELVRRGFGDYVQPGTGF